MGDWNIGWCSVGVSVQNVCFDEFDGVVLIMNDQCKKNLVCNVSILIVVVVLFVIGMILYNVILQKYVYDEVYLVEVVSVVLY